MNAGRKLRLATRLRHAKLGAALTSPYVASFIGCFILAASWVHFVSGLDVPPWTSVLIVLWAMFLAACQVLISSADGEADAEILRELLEDELQAGALRHEELARQIAVAITYRTNLQTALKIGGREDSAASLAHSNASTTGSCVSAASPAVSTVSRLARLFSRARCSNSGSVSSVWKPGRRK